MEVAKINDGLREQEKNSKYSNINCKTPKWIKTELQITAMDENNHSALVWRTLLWVCQKDLDPFNPIQENAFNDGDLDLDVTHCFWVVYDTELKISKKIQGESTKLSVALIVLTLMWVVLMKMVVSVMMKTQEIVWIGLLVWFHPMTEPVDVLHLWLPSV